MGSDEIVEFCMLDHGIFVVNEFTGTTLFLKILSFWHLANLCYLVKLKQTLGKYCLLSKSCPVFKLFRLVEAIMKIYTKIKQ